MTDQEQIIAQLKAQVKELELRLKASEEVYSEYLTTLLIKANDASDNTPPSFISRRIDEVHAKLRRG